MGIPIGLVAPALAQSAPVPVGLKDVVTWILGAIGLTFSIWLGFDSRKRADQALKLAKEQNARGAEAHQLILDKAAAEKHALDLGRAKQALLARLAEEVGASAVGVTLSDPLDHEAARELESEGRGFYEGKTFFIGKRLPEFDIEQYIRPRNRRG